MRHPFLCAALGVMAMALWGCAHTFEGNRDPVITELSANGVTVIGTPGGRAGEGTEESPLVASPGSVVVVVCRADDRDEDTLTYVWRGQALPEQVSPAHVLAWTAPADEGHYPLTCVVSDNRGGTASGTVFVQVVDPEANHAPAARLVPDKATLAPSASAQFVCAATDQDAGDTLNYAFLPTAGQVTVDPADGTKATYTAPAGAGSQKLYCVVGDGKGGYGVAVAEIAVE